MQYLTNFADEAVLLPLSVLLAVTLLLQGRKREAASWVLAVGGTLAVMLALKLGVRACAWRFTALGLHNPSGHTAAAAVVYGGMLALWLRCSRGTAMLLGIAVAVIVGATRLDLGVHSLADVLLGGAVGVAGCAALVCLAGPALAHRAEQPSKPGWVILALAVILLLHGERLPAEVIIHRAARAWLEPACR